MNYNRYVKELREVAEYFQKNRPDLPDVIATYKKSADAIEFLLNKVDEAALDLRETADCSTCKYNDTNEIKRLDYIPCGKCGPYYKGGWVWRGFRQEEP